MANINRTAPALLTQRIIARDGNVVRVDFSRKQPTKPTPPRFPGAAALRLAA